MAIGAMRFVHFLRLDAAFAFQARAGDRDRVTSTR
jgi:hypothetical protein